VDDFEDSIASPGPRISAELMLRPEDLAIGSTIAARMLRQ